MFDWLHNLLGSPASPGFGPDDFIVWEPCTHSHAEVVPGYVKYLLDLGFRVHVFMTPERYEEGLFERLSDQRLILHRRSQRQIRRLFRQHGLGQARGILITTARKISGKSDYAAEHTLFASRKSDQKLLLVEHDIKPPYDHGALTPDIITLRESHYQNAKTTVVNPHYFGTIKATQKNKDITRFITIGAMRSKRRNTQILVEAVEQLHSAGQTHFIITVIGRGNLKGIPVHLHRYFNILGRVNFTTLYAEMERADYFLTLLDPNNPAHDRYITTGTSGSFQLIYGFGKPCLIPEKFAAINGLNQDNSLVYASNAELGTCMQHGISLAIPAYRKLQKQLVDDAALIHKLSLENLNTLTSLKPPISR